MYGKKERKDINICERNDNDKEYRRKSEDDEF